MSENKAHAARRKNADQTGQDKAVVDDESSDMRSARAVELDRRKIARIGR